MKLWYLDTLKYSVLNKRLRTTVQIVLRRLGMANITLRNKISNSESVPTFLSMQQWQISKSGNCQIGILSGSDHLFMFKLQRTVFPLGLLVCPFFCSVSRRPSFLSGRIKVSLSTMFYSLISTTRQEFGSGGASFNGSQRTQRRCELWNGSSIRGLSPFSFPHGDHSLFIVQTKALIIKRE